VKWAGSGARSRERRNAYSVWVRKPKEKKLLGRNFVGGRIIRIKSMLKEYDGMVDWSHMAHDRGQWRSIAYNEMNICVP
jgi:hypothetical protein